MSDERYRDDLLVRVRIGEITPQEAEDLAACHGFGPLEGCRNPERFDPLQERRWTMPMAVAWIAWRDLIRVRDQMNAYRKAWKVWREYGQGWVLNSEERTSLIELQFGQDGEDYITVSDACADLWGHLQDGHLVATGISVGTRCPVPIPTVEWEYLSLSEGARYPNSVRAVDRLYQRGSNLLLYFDVRLRRDDVLNLWPETIAEQMQEFDPVAAEIASAAEPANRRRAPRGRRSTDEEFIGAVKKSLSILLMAPMNGDELPAGPREGELRPGKGAFPQRHL